MDGHTAVLTMSLALIFDLWQVLLQHLCILHSTCRMQINPDIQSDIFWTFRSAFN